MVSTIAAFTNIIAADTSFFGIPVLIGLIILLVTKELCMAAENPKLVSLSRKLNIAIVPLLIVFCYAFIADIY